MLSKLNEIIWGSEYPHIKPEIFRRWCQGFTFSCSDPTALQQNDGGPCAIIAAVQAYIIKHILFVLHSDLSTFKDDCVDLLTKAIVEIIHKASQNSHSTNLCYYYWSSPNASTSTFENFISGLSLFESDCPEDLYAIILSLAPDLGHEYSVLAFLYSVLMSCKSFEKLTEIVIENGSFIDPLFGHAGQCLLNLLITGCITPHVFNGEKNLEGFTITGITSQPDIGFLTLIEATMHCEVGWFLKNPAFPIWILGSESHFSVLASPNEALVRKENLNHGSQLASLSVAEMEFTSMCQAGDESGFISNEQFPELLTKLNIELNNDEIKKLTEELDPEFLGIILRNNFLDKFYPAQMAERKIDQISFQVIHYNSLPISNPNNAVKALYGNASLIDPEQELQNPSLSIPSSRVNDMLRCLRTKWPTIRVNWQLEDASRYPSLN